MCTGLEIAAIASLGLSAGGMFMNQQAQSRQMDAYNRQVNQQNREIEDQFRRRNAEIEAAQTQSARVADQIAAQQRDEWGRQEAIRQEKLAALQSALEGVSRPAQDTAMQEAAMQRQDTQAAAGDPLPGYEYAPEGTPNVVSETGARALNDGIKQGRSIAAALARIGGRADAAQQAGQTMRGLDQTLGTLGYDARRSAGLLDYALAPMQHKVEALNRSAGYNSGRPYASSVTPTYTPPNTMVGDLMSTAGQFGLGQAFLGNDIFSFGGSPNSTFLNRAAMRTSPGLGGGMGGM